MKIIRGAQNIPKPIPHPIVTIGNFDGVHLGHQALFKEVAQRTEETNGTSIVLTFEPHPLKITAPEKCPPFLTTFHQKLEVIEKTGIDMVICADFTPNFAKLNPKEFIKQVLLEKINVKSVIVGHDFKFGKGRDGTIASLQEMGKKLGFNVQIIEPIAINNQIVSSSLIRDLILRGDVKNAVQYLGRFYSLEGKVISGFKKGSAIGFPTANVDVLQNLVPHTGVYAVQVFFQNKILKGVANVGYNPTFNRKQLFVEVHIFNFTDNLYNVVIKVSFVDKIREEIVFTSEEDLKTQIQKDTITAKKMLLKDVK